MTLLESKILEQGQSLFEGVVFVVLLIIIALLAYPIIDKYFPSLTESGRDSLTG